jgi:hypothetical protein
MRYGACERCEQSIKAEGLADLDQLGRERHVLSVPRAAFPWLAPDITTAIVNGRKPPQLTAQALMRLTPRLPANWAEQRKLLGFR